ncbi:LCP family protein [Companilactobacillus nantensis]|uniref:Transcriptional regulator n=1 Tax=Companilactobacillus nantensis DSM 16982 TaxID=1423774 RepID=A0A0R1WBP0_9LACO|nr:LCP family protein [Companilactobacillus nantensis]KRM15281.1 transcriptional regulator [Companilactobacillus nantensis DSM 16982]GEO64390.1 LytR family transcriptional regulator [Companilactobacillus nantensis]
MQNRHKSHKSRKLRTFLIAFVLLFVFGGAALGMSKYRSVKGSVDSSFQSAGVNNTDVAAKLKAKKPISILIMGTNSGSDKLSRDYSGHTNSMMVVTINPETNKTTVDSVSGETALKSVSGEKSSSPVALNQAYALGQAGASVKTVQDLLNVPVDFYVLLNVSGLNKVVNEVGGIDVTPKWTFNYQGYSFTKGVKTHMNGSQALAYAGMSGKFGDYSRQIRQRQVVTGIVVQSGSISTLLNQDFINSLTNQVLTDLTFDNLKTIGTDYRAATKNVNQDHLDGTETTINGESMEVVSKSELQRETNVLRNSLGLGKANTGNIQYVPSTTATTTTAKY